MTSSLAGRCATRAYNQVSIEARILGCDGEKLVRFCFEELDRSLGQLIAAKQRNRPAIASEALSKALAALSALETGIDRSSPLAPALSSFYLGVRTELARQAWSRHGSKIEELRRDVADVASAMVKDSPMEVAA
ncbi:flagellar export chaperone FliS [Sphingomicrobium astaxanthinifaciens]|uniref:flagellar export chaperone FliS n=1 Tax=Sphingomicrobium astaxanthinifaciens TaxID=1227949 RepID=UPI001FCBBE24|nr:flagellar protein FliS [Sphingomicrobium astaxanthinifaciens]MCJ7420352.1 flagellar protein FliS [Sphingomicrobium astaxanthinifaciens]